ncbi:MAG: hypothetical protein ACO3R1_03005 [Litorivicinaceae bacterium]
MMVVATLLASLLGLCLGIMIQQSVYSLLVALIVPCVYWMIKRLTDHLNIHTIHSSTLPISIFKSEFDDVSFNDSATGSTKRKTISMSFGYIAGILVGNLFSAMTITTVL